MVLALQLLLEIHLQRCVFLKDVGDTAVTGVLSVM